MAGAGADNRASRDLETGTGDKDNSACLGVPQEAMVRYCRLAIKQMKTVM